MEIYFRGSICSMSLGNWYYAIAIVSAIFENPKTLSFVWASDRCTVAYDVEWFEYYNRKNLKKVKRKGYRLESIIAVDDTPQKWERSYGNLVRVNPFEGEETDDELKYLLLYLDNKSMKRTA